MTKAPPSPSSTSSRIQFQMEPPSQLVKSVNTSPIVSDVDKAQAEKHRHIGNAQMSANHYEQAIDSYTKAVSLNPYDAVHYSNRAAAYSKAGEHQKAVEDAEKGIRTDPSSVKAYQRLGHVHYASGNYSLAVSSFRRGLALDPTNSSLQQSLTDAAEACVVTEYPNP